MKDNSALDRFPYKNMLKIVQAVVDGSKEIVKIKNISRSGHSCWTDTVEITAMARFLGKHGQITKVEKGWIIKHRMAKPEGPTRFRRHYLREAEMIIDILSTTEPKDSKSIGGLLGLNPLKVEDYLQFLEKLTSEGHIEKYEADSGYIFNPWPQS